MTTTEYPFKYVGMLHEQYRERAMKDVDYCAEEVEGVCAHLVPRATKEEFLAWAAKIWEEAAESYSDYLSSRHD